MAGRYSMYPLISTELSLRQLDSIGYASNETKATIIPGGKLDVEHIGTGFASQALTITTRDLLSFFSVVSPAVSSRLTNILAYAQKRSDGSTFNASAVHESWSLAKADIVPISLIASQQDTDGAVLTAEIRALHNGSVEPVVRATSVDISGVASPTFASRYFLGPVYYNLTQLPNVERVEIQFGLGYSPKGFNGSPFPTEASVIKREPVIKVTTTDMGADAAVNILSRGCSDTQPLKVYFQAGAGCDDRVAAATAGHIKIAATYYEWTTESWQIQGNEDGTVTFTFRPRAGSALSVATASAIAA